MKDDRFVAYLTIIVCISILLVGFAVAKVLIMDKESRAAESTSNYHSTSVSTTEVTEDSRSTIDDMHMEEI